MWLNHAARLSVPHAQTVGFVGQHKKFCPLRKNQGPAAQPRTIGNPTLSEFADCLKKAGQISAVGDFLSSLRTQVNADPKVSEADQKNVGRLIQILLDELRDTANAKSNLDS